MSLIYPVQLEPAASKTPRNRPTPAINPNLQKRLTEIGGIVPAMGGKYAGMPVYRLAFGQSETHFCRGKERIRFPDADIEPVIVQERFFLSPEVFARAAEWQRQRDAKRVERFLNCDYTIFGENEPLSDYLKQHESGLDYVQLENAVGSRDEINGDAFSVASTITAPPNWFYLCDVKEVVEIGKNCWYVMRWISANDHGGRRAWEEMRYTIDAYIPELNAQVPMIDDLGEFPEYGFWIPRLEIAEYLEDGQGNFSAYDYAYTEPTEANSVEPIIEMLYQRAKLTNQDLNREWRTKKHETHLIEKRDAAIAAKGEELANLFNLENLPTI